MHERILDHYQNPRNYLDSGVFTSSFKNRFCGDEVSIRLELSGGGVSIRWHGNGCCYSMAAASMMCEFLNGKNRRQLEEFTEAELFSYFGKVEENRRECVLVAYHALQNALENLP